ncbi:MAG: hypothetical protein LBR88_10775, partial [Zoogloeaceae bacterium]|nr:hypothetical protein [Zoogloeaceae bacterium]
RAPISPQCRMNRSLIGVSSMSGSIDIHEFLARLKFMNVPECQKAVATRWPQADREMVVSAHNFHWFCKSPL